MEPTGKAMGINRKKEHARVCSSQSGRYSHAILPGGNIW